MDLDTFVHCTFVQISGHELKIMPHRNGSLFMDVTSPEEATRLCALSAVHITEVSCTDLLQYSEVKLLQVTNVVVVAVQRFQKIDGVLMLMPSFLLTLNRLVLPEEVH